MKQMYCLVILFVVFNIVAGNADPKHILFVSVPMHGHVNALKPFAQELADRGHKVSFLVCKDSHSWLKDLKGVTLMDGGPAPVNDTYMRQVFAPFSKAAVGFHNPIDGFLTWITPDLFHTVFVDANVQLFKSGIDNVRKNRPDLVIFDQFTFAGADLANAVGAPYISFSPFLLSWTEHLVAHHSAPRSLSGFGRHMSLWERFVNPLIPYLAIARLLSFGPYVVDQRIGYGAKLENPMDIYGDVRNRLQIIGSAFPLQIPRPFPPLIQFVGPDLPKEFKPLTPTEQKFLDGSQDLVVLISMGSLAPLEEWQVHALVKGLSSFKVIWSLPEEQQKFLPDNVPSSFLIQKWISQQSLLAHEKVQIFISHCGANGAHESLLLGKPLICVPHHADQYDIAMRIEENGAGHQLNKFAFTSDEVYTKTSQILKNPSYKESAAKLQKILKQAGGAKKAADLAEMHLTIGIDHLKEGYDPYPQPVDLFAAVWIAIPLFLVWKLVRRCCCARKTTTVAKPKVHQN